ncbi:MAG: class I SAM-dependent methyltransferase [Myxococcales bacterium]|nr:class I SAM-dependent methyltransferase [Myxococcales bacterium]
MASSTDGYAEQSEELLTRYETYDPEELWGWWVPQLPEEPADALDAGAGTGRDAAWLARRGHRVWAVEPVAELREGAQALHPEPGITWLDDRLPELPEVRRTGQRFDILLLSAVWMHLDGAERKASMATLAALARPGARLAMTLRHGPVPPGRRMFAISDEETIALAAEHGFVQQDSGPFASSGRLDQKVGVTFTRLAFVSNASR